MKLDKVIKDLEVARDNFADKLDLILLEVDAREDKFYDKSDSYQDSPAGARYMEITEELQDVHSELENYLADVSMALEEMQALDTKILKVVPDLKEKSVVSQF